MSEALERVIAELQAKVDCMTAALKVHDRASQDRHRKGEIFATAVSHYQANALRMIVTDPESREKWTKMNLHLRQEMREFGFCSGCGCLDYCQCDDGCSC